MQRLDRYAKRILLVFILLAFVLPLVAAKTQAQGVTRFRLPFDGTYRITAYFDHKYPTYGQDSYEPIVVYTGEDRKTCPEAYESWTTQGPYCYDGHDGVDYSMCNVPVLAAAAGTVISDGYAYGLTVKIEHAGGYVTWYSHLASESVTPGDRVSAGELIGVAGSTGTQACHLHFSVWLSSQRTDPYGWRGDYADPLPGGPAQCLWNDGQCTAVVVEDESEWFYRYGNGWEWFHRGWGWTMRYSANEQGGSAEREARWRPHLIHGGPYSVYAFIPAQNATTSNAQYIVNDKYGSHQVSLNQNAYSDEWVSLGSYDFWDDSISGWVQLESVTGETSGSRDVGFDAVKFQQYRIYVPTGLNNYQP
jgi:hypothetical protein